MPNIQKLIKFILYADDANILITGANAHEIITNYNEISAKLSDWVSANGLLLNVKKNYMIFSNINIGNLSDFEPKILNRPIEHKTVAKFLGIHIDEKLNWSQHVNSIRAKMSKIQAYSIK